MKSANDLEFPAYVADLVYTILFVFQRIVPPDALIEWLRAMVIDEGQRELLMHEEPLYIAADFLRINRASSSFNQYEQEYLHFRKNFLQRRNVLVLPTMERKLSHLVPKLRSYLRHLGWNRDVASPNFASKHASASHAEDFTALATLPKLMPHHSEHRFAPKIRHYPKSLPRKERAFTTKHLIDDLPSFG